MENINFDSLFDSDLTDLDTGFDALFDSGDDEITSYKRRDTDRAAELKAKEIYRKDELQYEEDGSLIHDSNAMIRTKEAANAGIRGVDWLLEASENILDFGQGDILGYRDQIQAENEGKRYSMQNKDFLAARSTTTDELINQYHTAKHDDNADKGIYTLRKFDGYQADGNPKYIYKYGLADVGANTRYRDQYVQDGFDIVAEKRFAGAEDWEKTWNASKEVLDARTLDSGRVMIDGVATSRDVASGINFGAGKTELLNEDLLGTDVGKTQENYDQNKAVSRQLSDIADAKWQAGLDDSVADAFQSGAAKLAVDTGDFILDVLTPGDNTLLNDVKKQENIDKWVGYDRTQSTQTLSDAATYWKQGDYFKAISNVVSDPNTMVESIPMMIAFFTPIPGTRVAGATKLIKGIDEARKAGKSLAEITMLERKLGAHVGPKAFETYKKYKDTPKTMRLLEEVATKGNFHLGSMVMTNNVLDDRIEEKVANGEPGTVGMAEVLGVYATQTLLLSLDRLSVEAIIGKGFGGDLVKKTFGMADEAGKKQIVRKIVEKGFATVGAGSAEGMQEYLQTWGEILGANAYVGDKSITDVLNDEAKQNEALMGGLGGLGAGVQMNVAAQGIPSAIKGAKAVYDEATMDAGEKIVRKATKLDDYDVEEVRSAQMDPGIISSIVFNGTDKQPLKDFSLKTTDSFNRAIDIIMSKRLDAGALEKAGINTKEKVKAHRAAIEQNMINNALIAAHYEAQNEKNPTTEPLNRVLALMQKLDKDPNSAFSLKEMHTDQSETLMDEFMDIMKTNYESTGKDYDSLTQEEKEKAELDARNQALDALKKRLKIAHVSQVLNTQGSTIIENEANLNIEAENGNSDLTVGKIHSLIQQYQDGGKDIKDVQNEFEKYGYIKESENKQGDKYIKIKPSLNKYRREITKQLVNDKTKNNMLHTNVDTGVTFSTFANFAKSRLNKLKPKKNANSGAVTDSKNTAFLLVTQEYENIKMKELIADWISLLETTKIGDDNTAITQENKDKYIAFLQDLDSELDQANNIIESDKLNIESWAENELGIDGVDLDNEAHRIALAGVYATSTIDEDGNIVDGPIYVKLKKGQRYEDRIAFMKKSFKAMGDTTSTQEETKAEPEIKEKKPKQTNNQKEAAFNRQIKKIVDKSKKLETILKNIGAKKPTPGQNKLIEQVKRELTQATYIVRDLGYTTTELNEAIAQEKFRRISPDKAAKPKAPQKDKEPVLVSNEEISGEIFDVSGMLDLLGINLNNTRQRVPTKEEVIATQRELLNIINTEGELDVEKIRNLFQDVDWVFSDDSEATSEHIKTRQGRAVSKIEERMKKTNIDSKERYIAYQLAEELNEVIESTISNKPTRFKILLDAQKSIYKILRFGPNTLIKDKDGNKTDKTNLMVATELLAKLNIETDMSNNTNINDYLLEMNTLIRDELNDSITEPETNMQTDLDAITKQYENIEEASMQEALIFTGSVKAFFEKYKNLSKADKDSLGITFGKMIRAVEATARKDVSTLEELFDIYKTTQADKKVQSGIIPKIASTLKHLNALMKSVAKRAEKMLEKIERKNLLLNDLKKIEMALDGTTEGNVFDMLNETLNTQRDIARMSKFLKTQKKGKLEVDFFGQALKTTEATYPAVKRFNDIIKKRLAKFKTKKANTGGLFSDNRGSFMKNKSAEYEAYKETVVDPMPFSEFLKNQGNDIESEQKKKAEDAAARAEYEALNEDELFDNPDLTLTDAGTVLLTVKNPKVIISDNNKEGFKSKKEYHITIVGFPLAKQINKLTKEQKDEIYSLINDANLSYELSEDVYQIEKHYKESRYTPKGGKEIVNPAHDRETLIVPIEVPGLDQLMADIQEVADLDIKKSFPHITLMVKGHKDGIGIPNREAFDTIDKILVTDNEVETVSKEEFDTKTKDELQSYESVIEDKTPMTEEEAQQELAKIDADIISSMETLMKECE